MTLKELDRWFSDFLDLASVAAIDRSRNGLQVARHATEVRRVAFAVENRTADAHRTSLRIFAPAGPVPELRRDGRRIALAATGDWEYPWQADIDVAEPVVGLELIMRRGR